VVEEKGYMIQILKRFSIDFINNLSSLSRPKPLQYLKVQILTVFRVGESTWVFFAFADNPFKLTSIL
jgi:hypothetical protein